MDLPAEDAVEADAIQRPFVLDHVRPGDLRRQRQVESCSGQALGEVALGQSSLVLLVLEAHEHVADGAQLEGPVYLQQLAAVVIPEDDLGSDLYGAGVCGIQENSVAREPVVSHRNDDSRVHLEGLAEKALVVVDVRERQVVPGVALEPQGLEGHDAGLELVLEIGDHLGAGGGGEAPKVPLRADAIVPRGAVLSNTPAVGEAQRGIEVVTDLGEVDAAVVAIVGIADLRPERLLGGAAELREAAHEEGVPGQDVAAVELAVEVLEVATDEARTNVCERVSLRSDQTDRRFSEDVLLHPDDAQVGRFVHAGLLGDADGEPSEVGVTESPGDLQAVIDVEDLVLRAPAQAPHSAGMKGEAVAGDAAELEDAGVLEEEVPAFREEGGKARELGAELVHGGFHEVGVDGQAGSHRGMELVEEVERGLGHMVRIEGKTALHVVVASVRVAQRPAGLDVDARAIDIGESRQGADAGDVHDGPVLRRIRPAHLLVLASNQTLGLEAPGASPRFESDGLEGNRELRRPALVVHRGVGVPDPVPVSPEPRVVLDQPLAAGSQWIDLEEIGISVVVEGVEDQVDAIVRRHVHVLDHLGCDQLVGLAVVHPDAQVEEVLVEEDPDLGALARLRPLDGIHLDHRIERNGVAPDGLVQNAVDHGRSLGTDQLCRPGRCGRGARDQPGCTQRAHQPPQPQPARTGHHPTTAPHDSSAAAMRTSDTTSTWGRAKRDAEGRTLLPCLSKGPRPVPRMSGDSPGSRGERVAFRAQGSRGLSGAEGAARPASFSNVEAGATRRPPARGATRIRGRPRRRRERWRAAAPARRRPR